MFPSPALPGSGSRGPGPHPVLRIPPPTTTGWSIHLAPTPNLAGRRRRNKGSLQASTLSRAFSTAFLQFLSERLRSNVVAVKVTTGGTFDHARRVREQSLGLVDVPHGAYKARRIPPHFVRARA